ncbi:hypothetical protein HK102_004766, partial [Quaeritorhiza haematococci]
NPNNQTVSSESNNSTGTSGVNGSPQSPNSPIVSNITVSGATVPRTESRGGQSPNSPNTNNDGTNSSNASAGASQSDSMPLIAIILLAVGGAILLILCILSIWFFCWRKDRDRRGTKKAITANMTSAWRNSTGAGNGSVLMPVASNRGKSYMIRHSIMSEGPLVLSPSSDEDARSETVVSPAETGNLSSSTTVMNLPIHTGTTTTTNLDTSGPLESPVVGEFHFDSTMGSVDSGGLATGGISIPSPTSPLSSNDIKVVGEEVLDGKGNAGSSSSSYDKKAGLASLGSVVPSDAGEGLPVYQPPSAALPPLPGTSGRTESDIFNAYNMSLKDDKF